MNAKFLVLRTHGGLGNQLFQILFGRLYAEFLNLELREIHDSSYPHGFPRCRAIALSSKPSILQSIFSAMRIPKILGRFIGMRERPLQLFNTIYIDGYFQEIDSFRQFERAAIQNQLNALANELGVEAAHNGKMFHLRLGDFFGDRITAMQHAIDRISDIPAGSWIMTNDEDLLNEPVITRLMNDNHIKLIATNGMPAEQVLCAMSRHSQIDANNSTLAFWAAVLGHSALNLSDKKLQDSYWFFRNLSPNAEYRVHCATGPSPASLASNT